MTPDSILALLRADPALAVEVARGIRVLHLAGPWEEDGEGTWRRPWIGGRSYAATLDGGDFGGWGRAKLIEERKAATDAALVAAGWVLAPPESGTTTCDSERAGIRCNRPDGHSGPCMGTRLVQQGEAWNHAIKPGAP